MKRFFVVVCSVLAAALVFSCEKGSEPSKPEKEKYVTLSIDVDVDTTGLATTKTSMDGINGYVKWSETDRMTVYFVGKTIDPVLTSTPQNIRNNGRTATFTYSVLESKAMEAKFSTKYLFYGAQELKVDGDKKPVSISLPSGQEYVGSGCFKDGENASIGYLKGGSYNSETHVVYEQPDSACVMKNIFGILKVNISLAQAKNIDYVQLTDNASSSYLAGEFNFTSLPGYEGGEPIISHEAYTGGESLSIIKKVSGNVTGGDFYFLVPPGTLFSSEGFNLYVYTRDGYYAGKRIKLSSTGSASIERSVVTNVPIGTFTPNIIPTDYPLTANSYIVPAVAGPYSIPAQYKGNGYQGNRNDKFTDPEKTFGPKLSGNTISGAVSADIIWQGRLNGDGILDGEVVSNAKYFTVTKDGNEYGYIGFHRSGVEGDALVAVKDAYGNILWSWHLWVVDTADVRKLNEGSTMYAQYDARNPIFTIMDRNLGALSADPADGSQFHGLAYQYGRKDPYMGTRFSGPNTQATGYASFASIFPATGIHCVVGTMSLGNSILVPNERAVPSSGNWCSDMVYWGDPGGDATKDSPKTLYDPCPAGWRTFEEKNLSYVLGLDQGGKIARPDGEVVDSGEGFAFMFRNKDSLNVSHPVYFPGAGYSSSTTEVTQIGVVAEFWGANYVSNQASTLPSQATAIRISMHHVGLDSAAFVSDIPHEYLYTSMPVRCQKWEEPANPNAPAPATSARILSSTRASEFLEEEIVNL